MKNKKNKNGLKKTLILLSILDANTRSKVLNNLNITEKQYILKNSYNKGSFDFIKKHISLKSLKIVLNELESFIKREKISNFYFELIYIVLLYPIFFYSILIEHNNININFLFYVFLLPFITFVLKQTYRFKFNTDFTNKNNFLLHTIIGFISGILLYIILIVINRYTFYAKVKFNLFNFLLLVIIIPLFEEFVFRYFTISILLKKSKFIIKIFISSIIFSFAHLNFDNIEILILYFFTGIILSTVYSEEKYIYPVFFAHSLANFLILFS